MELAGWVELCVGCGGQQRPERTRAFIPVATANVDAGTNSAWYPSGVKVGRAIRGGTVLILLALLQMPSKGQSESCIPDLTAALGYPAAVLESRIQGTVESTVLVDSAATAVEIQSRGYPALKDNVEAAIRAAQFEKRCANEHLSVRVNFVIDQNIEPNSKTLVKRPSNSTYDVIAPAQVVVVTISDPAWIFTRRGRFLHHMHRFVSKLRFW
jgi:hypothetical protein